LINAGVGRMSFGPMSVSRIARAGGILALDAVGVLVGTALLESPLHPIFPVHSASGVLRREVILSILCAALIGFIAYWKLRSGTSKAVWTLFLLLFGLGIFVSAHEPGGSWAQLSGTECSNTMERYGCISFWAFTIPLIRAFSYSCGAFVAGRFYGSRAEEAAAGGVLG